MARAIDLSRYSSEAVEVEIDGETYRGIRFVTGMRTLRQEIHFEDLRQIDPKAHAPRDLARMRRMARVMLRDLVQEWKSHGARPARATPRRARRRSPR
jgi:hypothetical protein